MNRIIPYGTVISLCMFQPNICLANFGCFDTERCLCVSVLSTLSDQSGVAEVLENMFGRHPVRISAPLRSTTFFEFFAIFCRSVIYKNLVWKREKKLHGSARRRCIGE